MWLIAWTWLLVTGASAQVEACSGPLTGADWQEALDEAEVAVAAFNGEQANRILDDLVYELRCADRPADPRDLGRLARLISLMAFYDQDSLEAESWALLARETVGGAPWTEALPVPPTYHHLVADLPAPETVRSEGSGLATPKKGAVLLDGRFLAEPEAVLGTMHLLQVADKKGRVQTTRWQHGAAFPEDVLGPPGTAEPPRWYEPPPEPLAVPSPPPTEPPPVEAEPDAVAVAPAVPDSPKEPLVSEEERSKMFESADPQEGCPWRREPTVAVIKGNTVRVNKQTYKVKTTAQQRRFKSVLRKCGELRAVRRFNKWRDAKKKLSFQAPRYKKALLKALLTEEKRGPRRKARRQ